MPIRVLDARIDLYQPDGTLRAQVASNIRRIDIDETATDEADRAGFDLAHDFADLSDFVEGDEVQVFIQTEADVSLNHVWTGIIDSIRSDRHGSEFADLPIQAQDYVYWALAHSYVTDSFTDMAAGAIVRSILTNYVAGIDGVNVEDTGTTVPSIVFNGESALSCIRRLAQFANATFHGNKDKELYFFESATKASGLSLGTADVVRGTFYAHRSMADFGNALTVRGSYRKLEDSTGPAVFSAWSTVTGLVRKTARIYFTKSRVARVDLYTDPTGFAGPLTLRLQADNAAGTAPVAETDPTFDLASKIIEAEDLAVDGWTSFDLPAHIAAPGSYVWLIVESDADGQRVGVDASADLMWVSYFDFPVIVQRIDVASVNRYGRRELPPVTDTSIRTEEEADALAQRILAEHKDPVIQGGYEVLDIAAFNPTVGRTVAATFPKDGIAAGTALIVQTRRHVYDANDGTYRLSHTYVSAARAQALQDVLRAFSDRIKRLEDKDQNDSVLSLVSAVGDNVVVSDTLASVEDDPEIQDSVVGTAQVGSSHRVFPA